MTTPIVARRRRRPVTSRTRPAGLRQPSDRALHTLRMDRNAYRDDNGTDQLGTPAGYPRARADAPSLYADDRDSYPGESDPYPGESAPYPDQPDTYWRRRAATLAA